MAAIVLTKAETNTGEDEVEKAEDIACLIKGHELHCLSVAPKQKSRDGQIPKANGQLSSPNIQTYLLRPLLKT